MNKRKAGAVILGSAVGIAAFHVIHYERYCKYKTDPEKSHCAACGRRPICQKAHHRDRMNSGVLLGDIKKELTARYGKETADELWREAEREYTRLRAAYPDLKGDGQNMWTLGAIYNVLVDHDPENALLFLCECGKKIGVKLRGLVHSLTALPYMPEFLWKHMPELMEKASGEARGYTRRIVSESDRLVGVDILSCPIHDAAKAMGIEEAARIVCAMDKEYMTGFKRIDYTRTMSVAEGDPCCDYRLSYNKSKI